MIPGHEKQTHELTEYELEKILPLVVKRMKEKVGKKSAVTNSHVVKMFKKHGYKLTESRFRKIIQHIRVNGLIPCLVSSGHGYYIATKQSEVEMYVKSLDKRINAVIVTRDSLQHQMKQMFDQPKIDENPFG